MRDCCPVIDRYAIFLNSFQGVHFSLTIVVGEGILPYLPTLMEKLLLALSPSTVSYILQVTLKEKISILLVSPITLECYLSV